jgi:hypothetical protein
VQRFGWSNNKLVREATGTALIPNTESQEMQSEKGSCKAYDQMQQMLKDAVVNAHLTPSH